MRFSIYLELFSTLGQHDYDADVVFPDQAPKIVQRIHRRTYKYVYTQTTLQSYSARSDEPWSPSMTDPDAHRHIYSRMVVSVLVHTSVHHSLYMQRKPRIAHSRFHRRFDL